MAHNIKMDFLPDELLIQILKDSYEDPSQILKSLCLVCRRWHHLFEDKYCWSEADLSLTDTLSLEAYKQLAVTLIKAPRLHSLTVIINSKGIHKDLLIKCLKRCSENTKKIDKVYLEIGSQDSLFHICSFLIRNSLDDLQFLSFKLMTAPWSLLEKSSFRIGELRVSFLGMMLHFKELQELHICLNGKLLSYERHQTSCCPPLKKLTIHGLWVEPDMYLKKFCMDIVSLTSSSLESVELQVRNIDFNQISNVFFPKASTLKFGFLHKPVSFPVQNFPMLRFILLCWFMHGSDTGTVIKDLRALFDTFNRPSISCTVRPFGFSPSVFYSQEFKDFISSLPERQAVDYHVYN